MDRRILSGWKEIANHLQRGVRTAQRWEAYLGMPVHRPAHKDRSAVVAFSDELDGWIARTAPDGAESSPNEALVRVHDNISSLASETIELASRTHALREQLRRSAEIHGKRLALRTRARAATASGRARGAMLPFRPRHTPGRELLFP